MYLYTATFARWPGEEEAPAAKEFEWLAVDVHREKMHRLGGLMVQVKAQGKSLAKRWEDGKWS